MADESDILYGLDLDVTDALSELQRLAQGFKQTEGQLQASAQVLGQRIANFSKAYARGIQDQFDTIKEASASVAEQQQRIAQQADRIEKLRRQKKSTSAARAELSGMMQELDRKMAEVERRYADLERREAKQAQVASRQRQQVAAGSDAGQNRRAVTRGQINEIRSSQQALANQISKEILKQVKEGIQLSPAAIRAAVAEQKLATRNLVAKTSPEAIVARAAMSDFALSELQKSAAQIGTTGRRNDNRRTIERIEDTVANYQAKIVDAAFASTQRLLNTSEEVIKRRMAKADLGRYRDAAMFSDEQLAFAREAIDYRAERRAKRYSRDGISNQAALDNYGDTMRADRAANLDLETDRELARRRREERAYRAQYGDAALGMQKSRERRQLNGGADYLSMQAGELGNYAILGAVTGSVYALGSSIVSLDAEFKQFQAITATTTTEMAKMEERLLSVAERSKFTATEIAEAATLMGQAGLSAKDVAAAIEPISQLATAAGTDLRGAVDVVTSTLNVFQLQTTEAAHLSDVFTTALNKSKLTLDQLALAVQYAGSTAATSGVGYNELTASIGALANAGIRSGSTIGTGIRQVMVDLLKPSKAFKEQLAALGLSMDDVDVQANGLTGAITNLRNAGFGTTEAFRSMEVRGAAAFVALSSNLDTVADMREAFLLSTAAADANAVQMGSLANTSRNLGTHLSTLTYRALRPFLATVQDFAERLSGMLAVMSQFSGTASFVGSAVAGIATAFAAVKIGNLAAGFLGIGSAATSATGAVAILFNLIKAHPIGLAIAAITTAIALLHQFGDASSTTAAEIDEIKSALDRQKGTIDETKGRMQLLATTIEDLTAKQANLDKTGNEGMRRLKVMEVVGAFKELAGKVDTSKTSVLDLIDALKGLKGELAGKLPEQFQTLVSGLDLEILKIGKTIEQYQKIDGKEATLTAGMKRFDAPLAGGSEDPAAFDDQVRSQFGKDIADTFKTLGGRLDLNGDQVTRLREVLATRSNELAADEERNGKTSDRTADREFIDELKTAFEPLYVNSIRRQAAEAERRANLGQANVARLTALDGYQALDNDTTKLGGEIDKRAKGILDANGGIIKTKEGFDALNTWFNDQVKSLNDRADKLKEELVRNGMSEKDATEAVEASQFQVRIAEIQSLFDPKNDNAKEAYRLFQVSIAKRKKQTLDGKISNQMDRLGKVKNEQEADLIESQVLKLYDELAATEREIFEKDTRGRKALGDNPAELEIAEREFQEQQADTRKEIVQDLIDRRAKIYEAEQKATEDALKTDLANVEAEMSAAIKEMGNTNSVEAVKVLRDKIEELAEKARKLAAQIAGIDVSTDVIAAGGGYGTTAANMRGGVARPLTGDTVPQQVWNFFASKGLASHQIAGILGNVQQESTFNPLAVGDKGQAFGLFQHNDRKQALFDFIGGRGNLGDVQKQLEFAWHELQTSENGSYQKLIRSGNVQEAAEAFLGFERPSGYQTGVRNSHGYANRVSAAEEAFRRYGATDGTDARVAARSTELSTTANRDLQTANEMLLRKQSKALQKSLSREADGYMAEIDTLTSQVSNVTKPDAIQSILASVKDKWQKVMDAETRVFTEKNKGSEDFETDLENFHKGLNAKLSQDVNKILDNLQAAIEREEPEALKVARAKLSAAQAPENEGKFTAPQVQALQNNVVLEERAALEEKVANLEKFRTLVASELADAEERYGATSEQANTLRQRQAEVEKSVGDQRVTLTAQTEAASKAQYDFADAMNAANIAFGQQQGFRNSAGEMRSLAEQTGDAWGEVLDTLQGGFENLFMDLATGTKSAGEAFKAFGLEVVQSFMQMIAKALAFQLIQSTLGSIGGTGGSFLSSLFAVPGMAVGGTIPGVKGAAGGEYITGGTPNRDSVLRNLMPGEYVLRSSAVNVIGRDKLDAVNALGNRTLADGVTPVGSAPAADGGTVNVYVVLPEDKPQVGPRDIVAAVSDDMRNRGITRQLVRAISMNQI